MIAEKDTMGASLVENDGKTASIYGTFEELVQNPFFMKIVGYIMQDLKVPDQLYYDDSTVWHYTNVDGLLGILKTRTFWATQSSFLNDSSEGMHTLTAAKKIIRDDLLNADEAKQAFLGALLESISDQINRRTFLTCFCRNGDLLSQWRGYGNFGAGYALGFRVSALRPDIQIAWLASISYDQSALISLIRSILDIYYRTCALSEYSEVNYHGLKFLAKDCAESFRFCSSFFKHPAYHEEQEVRLIAQRDGDVERPYHAPVLFRSRGQQIVPYIEMSLEFAGIVKEFPLSEIIIGPGVPFETGKEALSAILKQNNLEHVTIRQSEIPFRN